jgi:hypothetical protein
VNIEPTDNEGRRLRVGTGRVVIHSLYSVFR